MKPAIILLSGILIAAIPFSTVCADEDSAARMAEMQAKIERLEAELDTANQTIETLEAELEKSGQSSTAPAAAAVASQVTANQPATDSAQLEGNIIEGTAWAGLDEQNMQNAAGAVTILGPEVLSVGGVEDISRLELLVPGLRFGQSGHEARLAMRGARTIRVGSEADPVVAIYEDGVYVPTTTQALDGFLDVQRVEVSRGPQNTRFGHNAFAGAISIINNKPEFDEIKGFAEAQNSLPDRTRFEVAINLPFSDTFAMRVAGLSDSRSGLIGNHTVESDSDDLYDRTMQMLRIGFRWQPTENLDTLLSLRYLDENGSGTAIWGYQQIGAYINGELKPGHQFRPRFTIPDIGPWDVFRNFASAAEMENWLNTFTLNWDMGFASLEWISNYTIYEGRQVYDNDYSDGGEIYNSDFAGWESSQDSWSTELRLTSNSDGPLSWLLGMYLYDQEAEWGWLAARKGYYVEPEWDVRGIYHAESKAVFGQLDYALSERFRLSGGLRWTEDTKTLKSGETDSWDDVLWNAALEYDLRDSMMTYVSASTGYRPGGLNSMPGVPPLYDPEKLKAYEIGLKSTLAGGSLMLNLAAFYNDYSDLQAQSYAVPAIPGSAPGASEFTITGGEMESTGLEAELQWAPTPNWNIRTNVAYVDAEFGNYTVPKLAGLGDIPGHTDGEQLSLDGWRPAMSPKWTMGLQASYDWHFANWGILTPYFQTTYMSDYYAADINLAGTLQDSHTRTDARLIWTAPKGNIAFQLYYLNIEDEAQLNNAVMYNPAVRPDIATVLANWTDQRSYGVIFSYTF